VSIIFLLKLVLSQVDHDPLLRVNGLKKLECFSNKRFKELKGIFKEIVTCYSESDKKRSSKEKKKGERIERLQYQGRIQRNTTSFRYIYKDMKEDVWWEKEKWNW